MYLGVNTSSYKEKTKRVKGIRAMDSTDSKFFSSIGLKSNERQELDDIIPKKFIKTEEKESITTLRKLLPQKLFVCKNVQEK